MATKKKAPAPAPTQENAVETLIPGQPWRSGGHWVDNQHGRLCYLETGYTLEAFNGNDWVELAERRPHGNQTSYTMPPGFPEGYVRATDKEVVLWPAPTDTVLLRGTPPAAH